MRSVSTSAGFGSRSSSEGSGIRPTKGWIRYPVTKVEPAAGRPQLDRGGRERDLLLGLSQGGAEEVAVVGVLATAGNEISPAVAAEVGAALGEDQAGALGPAVER